MPLLFLALGSTFAYGASASLGGGFPSTDVDGNGEPEPWFQGIATAIREAIDAGFRNVFSLLLLPVLILVLLLAGAWALTRVGFFEAFGKSARDVSNAIGLGRAVRAFRKVTP